jgi:hypothetical protein
MMKDKISKEQLEGIKQNNEWLERMEKESRGVITMREKFLSIAVGAICYIVTLTLMSLVILKIGQLLGTCVSPDLLDIRDIPFRLIY